jgi:hypothetical protein
MPQEMKTLSVTVTAPEDQLSSFVHLCKTIQYLCSIGSSRTVEIPVDGDGNADMRFDFGETDISEIEPVRETGSRSMRVPGIGG